MTRSRGSLVDTLRYGLVPALLAGGTLLWAPETAAAGADCPPYVSGGPTYPGNGELIGGAEICLGGSAYGISGTTTPCVTICLYDFSGGGGEEVIIVYE